MDNYILAIQLGFYIGIVLIDISNCFFLPREKIIYLQHIFFLSPNMLICPSNIFSSTTVMLLGQVFTFKRSFLLELSTRLLEKSLVVNLLF